MTIISFHMWANDLLIMSKAISRCFIVNINAGRKRTADTPQPPICKPESKIAKAKSLPNTHHNQETMYNLSFCKKKRDDKQTKWTKTKGGLPFWPAISKNLSLVSASGISNAQKAPNPLTFFIFVLFALWNNNITIPITCSYFPAAKEKSERSN